jgi:hypothetical protein
MLTLLGSALGLFTSFLPKVMDYFQNKQDNAHELAMLEKVHSNQMEMTAIDASIREVETIHEHDASMKSGYKWMDAYRASVRPTLAYGFFLLFVFVEVSAYILLLRSGMGAMDATQIVWDAEMNALWAAIVSFYFGNRSFRK